MVGAEKDGPGDRPGPAIIMRGATAPVLRRRCRDARSIASAVEAVIGRRGLSGIARPPTPRTLALFALALTEVLYTVLEHSGLENSGLEQSGGRPARGLTVELWTEPGLAVVTVGFAGPPLPGWLLANWERGEEPEVPEALADCGWGWLFVRETLDAVSAAQSDGRAGGRQILFLEKRL